MTNAQLSITAVIMLGVFLVLVAVFLVVRKRSQPVAVISALMALLSLIVGVVQVAPILSPPDKDRKASPVITEGPGEPTVERPSASPPVPAPSAAAQDIELLTRRAVWRTSGKGRLEFGKVPPVAARNAGFVVPYTGPVMERNRSIKNGISVSPPYRKPDRGDTTWVWGDFPIKGIGPADSLSVSADFGNGAPAKGVTFDVSCFGGDVEGITGLVSFRLVPGDARNAAQPAVADAETKPLADCAGATVIRLATVSESETGTSAVWTRVTWHKR